jgi:membrane protease YdiL (CAAX protease family)
MTAIAAPLRGHASGPLAAWVQVVLVAVGLAAIVAVRWSATRAGLDGLAVGAAFGAGLLLLAAPYLGGGPRAAAIGTPAARRSRLLLSVVVGSVVGVALVAVTVVGPALGGVERVPGFGRPAVAFLPWVLVTILVASTEEAVLRGVLFDRVDRAAGVVPALILTTAAFALLHVPFYGWHVVPLDLAVGLYLGGLRVATRSVAAPAAAHAVADLATWSL